MDRYIVANMDRYDISVNGNAANQQGKSIGLGTDFTCKTCDVVFTVSGTLGPVETENKKFKADFTTRHNRHKRKCQSKTKESVSSDSVSEDSDDHFPEPFIDLATLPLDDWQQTDFAKYVSIKQQLPPGYKLIDGRVYYYSELGLPMLIVTIGNEHEKQNLQICETALQNMHGAEAFIRKIKSKEVVRRCVEDAIGNVLKKYPSTIPKNPFHNENQGKRPRVGGMFSRVERAQKKSKEDELLEKCARLCTRDLERLEQFLQQL